MVIEDSVAIKPGTQVRFQWNTYLIKRVCDHDLRDDVSYLWTNVHVLVAVNMVRGISNMFDECHYLCFNLISGMK